MIQGKKFLMKVFNKINNKYNVCDKEVDYSEIVHVFASFENTYKMNKEDFLEKIFEGAFTLIHEAEKASFYELTGDNYIPIFSKGYDMEILKKLIFKREDAFCEYKLSDISNIEAYEICVKKRDDRKYSKEIINIFKELGTYKNYTSLYAPIQVDGLNVGIICFDCFNKSKFSKKSKTILKLYVQIISNFYTHNIFHEKEKKMYDEIVSAIEVKDKYTEGHAKRVREYSCAIAEELKFAKCRVNSISKAALLHDIGKIGIPTEIINKPGKLTDYEYNIIKKHPVYTKTILEKISGFSEITDFAYSHHENYDGTGYPQGLKNNEIPIESQIIQVADAYDAMTSERAYRKSMSPSEALYIIKKEMGKQFNPTIANVAIKIFSE